MLERVSCMTPCWKEYLHDMSTEGEMGNRQNNSCWKNSITAISVHHKCSCGIFVFLIYMKVHDNYMHSFNYIDNI